MRVASPATRCSPPPKSQRPGGASHLEILVNLEITCTSAIRYLWRGRFHHVNVSRTASSSLDSITPICCALQAEEACLDIHTQCADSSQSPICLPDAKTKSRTFTTVSEHYCSSYVSSDCFDRADRVVLLWPISSHETTPCRNGPPFDPVLRAAQAHGSLPAHTGDGR